MFPCRRKGEEKGKGTTFIPKLAKQGKGRRQPVNPAVHQRIASFGVLDKKREGVSSAAKEKAQLGHDEEGKGKNFRPPSMRITAREKGRLTSKRGCLPSTAPQLREKKKPPKKKFPSTHLKRRIVNQRENKKVFPFQEEEKKRVLFFLKKIGLMGGGRLLPGKEKEECLHDFLGKRGDRTVLLLGKDDLCHFVGNKSSS